MKNILTIGLVFIQVFAFAQINIDVNPNFKHTVGGLDSFDRSRFITIHADITEPDWANGNNLGNFVDLRDSFLNGLDVYMGRNTGGISWHFNQVKEDPNRTGFADPNDIANRGRNARNSYANQTRLHAYEDRNNLIIAAQAHPFFPDGTLTRGGGWAPANGTAVGEYMGRYINEFHSGNGQPKPAFVEVMNEPLWDFVTNGPFSPTEVFQFHNDVADAIRGQTPDAFIGGYAAAFPNFEEDNFQRWNDRWKLFMDMSGEKMDFWAVHFYDFNFFGNGNFTLRRGSNIEATFDMMEHYSQLSFDRVKPFVISEYGGRARQIEKQPWSPFRDWMTMKSFNSMLLTFADRPQHILSALPFVIVKAEWGRLPDGTPYPWRLMRQAKEKNGETGDHWVFTEIVKFYQLWSDVRGKRVDIVSSDPDIQTNAFVNENKLYVVLNNLYFDETSLDLKVLERYGNAIQNVKVKHLHLNDAGDAPVLEEENFSTLESVNIGGEGTIVIEYTFEEDLVIDETVEEIKYYANQYLTEIIPFAEHTYQINGVSKGETGEALLRLGMGRPHGTSLQPTVKVNGQVVEVPENYMGYDQLTRSTWFGVIQIPVPCYYLQEDNEITVQFPDAEGHISSMSLRLFNQSDKIERTVSKSIESISLQPAFKQLEPQQEYALQTNIAPINAIDFSIEWTSNDENIATVDDFGKVTAINLGEATITASMGDIIASSTIEVVEEALPVAVTGLQISPESISLKPGDLLQMQSQISPIDATNQEVEWIISDTNIAEIDENGLLKTKRDGEIQVIGTSQDGSFSDTSTVTVVAAFGTFLRCNFLPSTLVSDTEYTVGIDYSAGYAYDLAIELKDADDNWIGEGRVTVEPGIGTATVVIKNVSTEDWTTPIYPEPGEGYILRAWIREVGGNWMTNMGGCSKGGITITANTTNTTDIELSEMMLYPNPTDDLLFLDLPKLKREAQLTIFDIYGKVVLQQDIIQKNSQLQLSNFAAGIYLVQVQTEKGSVTKLVVVE